LFHKDKRHDIEDYYILKKEIERLITKIYLNQFLKRDSHHEWNKEEPGQSMPAIPKINMILSGTSRGGDSNNEKRKYRK
jgi:hypothetical protein